MANVKWMKDVHEALTALRSDFVCLNLSSSFRSFLVWFTLALLTISLSSCKKNTKAFDFLEEEPSISAGEVDIVGYTPEDDPVVVAEGKSTTFAVSLGPTAGNEVTYVWKLDDVEAASGSNPFYVLNGSSVTSGSHSLVVEARNTKYGASKTFNVRKNAAPALTLTTPGATGNSVNVNGSISFSVQAADSDGDSLSYTWKLNGVEAPSVFAVTSSTTTSTAIFSPTLAQVGSGTIKVEVYDGHDTTSYSWGIDVVNPITAAINSYSPTTALVVVTSTGSVDFSISATAKTPTIYSWKLDGVAVGTATNLYTLTGAGLTVGTHTLIAKVEDSDSSDTHTFSIKRNAAPVLSNPLATPSSQVINYGSQMTITIDGTDANSDALNYTWTLNGNPSATLSASNTATGSQVIFQPNVSLTGNHTISVSVTDNTETANYSWSVSANRFTDACNQLTAGKICTLVGVPSGGSGLNPVDDQTKQKIYPRDVIDDGSGNWVYADSHNNAIWFYNRSGSDIVRLGKTIPAGTTVMVVGNGAIGRTDDFSTYNNFKLYNPSGIAYDAANDRLFIADISSHRVAKIDSAGVGSTLLGTLGTGQGGATNNQDTAGTTHVCGNPRDLVYLDPDVYVTCSQSNSIKRVNANTGLARVVVGTVTSGSTSAGNGEGTAGSGAGTAQVNAPQGIEKDSLGNIYWTEVGSGNDCRLRVWNRTAGTINFFNSTVSVLSGQTATLAGSAADCSYVGGARAALRLGQVYGFGVHESGGVVQGFFLPSYNYHRVMYVNNLNSSQAHGGTTVNALEGATVLGDGNAAYNGDGALGNLVRVYNPFNMSMTASGNDVLLADYNNLRIRRMTLASGLISTDVGAGRLRYGLVGGADENASEAVLNLPYDMSIDAGNSKLYFTDSGNYRIRQVDLITGLVSTAIGEGNAGDGNIQNEDPTNVRMRDPRGVIPFGNHLLYSDSTSGNCLVRAYNRAATAQTIFGVTINSMRVSTIAGNIIAGCATFQGSGGAATNARLRNPEGIVTDGTNLFIADSADDCILKVSSSGIITSYLGTCNSGNYGEGPLAGITLNDPTSMVFDPSYPGTGNFFFVDQANQGTARIRYANYTGAQVTIAGVPVNANSANTIFAETGTPRLYGIAAFSNQLCYSSGHTNGLNGNHNVICRDRSSGLAPVTLRAGSSLGDVKGSGGPLHYEHEGVDAFQALLNRPGGLAFDASGNLYIIERNNSLIRKVKRWF